MKVSASFLSSANPALDLSKLNDTDVDYIHVDIMDGKFVKNKTMPFSEMKNIYKYTSKRLDVHLMVENPKDYIPLYSQLNTEYITFHVEVDEDIMECLEMIKKYSIKAGLSIKPNTKISELIPYLPYVDMILVMSVEPGMGGQSFIEDSEMRIDEVKALLNSYNIPAVVNVDGGINNETVMKCSAGALNHVNIIQVTNLVNAINYLKDKGFFIYGAEADGENYKNVDYNDKRCLVMGSEGKGISPIVRKNCDVIVSLPMKGHVNSLNVSVATAIFIYEMGD